MKAGLHKEDIYIGAEIFIEPGQTKEEIDGWFRIMKDHGLKLTRIRMFENYMRDSDGHWDFNLFDLAFEAGEKYGVKIYANLFPGTVFSDVGGFKFPKSNEHFKEIADYIRHVVLHFSRFTSLYGWVPINEPGSEVLPQEDFTREKLEEWKLKLQAPAYQSNGFTTLDLAEQQFLVDYNTWFLGWLCQEIRLYDSSRPIHVNNHDIFRNAAEYDFPKWRSFLSSLGGSAHASWHFGYFKRSQYAVAMSANAEMLRSGAGDIPWMMTELQGGNNTYSGRVPMCPTKEEIAQWIWINIGSGSRGAVFWCLNPRRSGFEAGEWALLNFLDQPSDRLLEAAKISEVLEKNKALFDQAKVLDSGISVIYTRESIWIEKMLQISESPLEGRAPGGVMKSALAYFETLSEMGIPANFQEIAEFNFDKNDYTDQAVVLAHQISIPSVYWKKLEHFVSKGGTLLVDGMTAYYDENACCIMGGNFPLREVFGGQITEFKLVSDLFDAEIRNTSTSSSHSPDFNWILKAHLWQGYLLTGNAEAIAYEGDEVIASEQVYGKGKVVWLPMLVGIGARLTEDYSQLSKLLFDKFKSAVARYPIRFRGHHKGLLMKVLQSGDQYISIVVNKSNQNMVVEIDMTAMVKPVVLFGNESVNRNPEHFTIASEETLVVKWDKYC